MVVASTVAYSTGGRTDIDALASLCARRNVLLLVDGAQSVGALHLDVTRTPIDALAVGVSKFLCGPPGFGFLYVRRDRAEALRPASLARYGVDLGDAHESEQGAATYRLMPGARRFEAGSFNYVGANATICDMTVIGIEQHVLALAGSLRSGLADLGLPLIGGASPERPPQIVVLGSSAGGALPCSAGDLHGALTRMGVKLSVRHGRLRLAFHLYNAAEDVTKTLSLISDHLHGKARRRSEVEAYSIISTTPSTLRSAG